MTEVIKVRGYERKIRETPSCRKYREHDQREVEELFFKLEKIIDELIEKGWNGRDFTDELLSNSTDFAKKLIRKHRLIDHFEGSYLYPTYLKMVKAKNYKEFLKALREVVRDAKDMLKDWQETDEYYAIRLLMEG